MSEGAIARGCRLLSLNLRGFCSGWCRQEHHHQEDGSYNKLTRSKFGPLLLLIAPYLASKPTLSAAAFQFSTPQGSALSPGALPVEVTTGLPASLCSLLKRCKLQLLRLPGASSALLPFLSSTGFHVTWIFSSSQCLPINPDTNSIRFHLCFLQL